MKIRKLRIKEIDGRETKPFTDHWSSIDSKEKI